MTTLETTSYIILVMIHAFTWAVPAFIVMLYIFSENGWLWSLSGLDTLSLFFVEMAMRDISFVIHAATTIFFWFIYFDDSLSALQFWFALLYSLTSSGIEYGAWIFGVNAIKYIDPTWDE